MRVDREEGVPRGEMKRYLRGRVGSKSSFSFYSIFLFKFSCDVLIISDDDHSQPPGEAATQAEGRSGSQAGFRERDPELWTRVRRRCPGHVEAGGPRSCEPAAGAASRPCCCHVQGPCELCVCSLCAVASGSCSGAWDFVERWESVASVQRVRPMGAILSSETSGVEPNGSSQAQLCC